MSAQLLSTKFLCEKCDYNTDSKKDYNKHISTRKHLRIMKDNNLSPTEYKCECGKVYRHQSGLCKHKHVCTYTPDIVPEEITPSTSTSTSTGTGTNITLDMISLFKEQMNETKTLSSVILDVVKENKELRELMVEQTKQMMELAKNSGTTINNNTTNNKFNLNFFLNETCKDAITMSEFINSFEVTREDFIRTGNVGFVEGISTVMMNRIRNMELHTRPLHCTDLKRETIYIKNDDKWEKEDSDKTQLRKAVKVVAHRNMNELKRWFLDSKPEVDTIGTDEYENYFKYYQAALGGYDKEEDIKFEEKIIKNVLKEVVLDKIPTVPL
jgi:hypothetical protein